MKTKKIPLSDLKNGDWVEVCKERFEVVWSINRGKKKTVVYTNIYHYEMKNSDFVYIKELC